MQRPEAGFGRRGANGIRSFGGASTEPAFANARSTGGIAGAGAKSAGDTTDATAAISQSAKAIVFWGEILAFLGMVASVFIAAYMPDAPSDLSGLAGKIYIPDMLKEGLTFDKPSIFSADVNSTVHTIDIDGSLQLAFLAMGLAAVMFRRTVLAGLVAAFFAFPWWLAGFDFAGAPTIVLAMVAAVGLRFTNLQGWKLLAAVVAFPLLGPAMLSFVAVPVSAVQKFGRPEPTRYHVVRATELFALASHLKGGEKNPASSQIPSLVHIAAGTSKAASAKAFVMAQEFALSGKGAEAVDALAAARADDRNDFETRRLAKIESWAAASGFLGEAARENANWDYKTKNLKAWLFSILASMVAVSGFFADQIAKAMGRRSRRIKVAIAERDRNATRLSTPSTIPVGAGPALSADEGEKALDRIAGRGRIYAIALFAAFVFSGVFFYAAWRFDLPAATANGAFSDVGVPTGMWDLARNAGWIAQTEDFGSPLDFLLAWPLWLLGSLQYLALPLSGAIYFRLRRTRPEWAAWAAPIVAGSVFVAQIGIEAPDFSMTQFTQAARFSVADRTMLAELTRDPESTGGRTNPANASQAAFLLAQIAYSEGNSADAARYLVTLVDTKPLQSTGASWRLAVLREWVASHGNSAGETAADPIGFRTIDTIRQAGSWASTIAKAFVFLALIALGFLAWAIRRYRRIENLVEARRLLALSTPIAH